MKLPITKVTELKKCPEVEEFLSSISMQKYLNAFLENGFEDLETVLELRDEDFVLMRIPLGHKLRMMKRIKELKPPELRPVVEPQKLKGIQKNVAQNSIGVKADLPTENKEEPKKKVAKKSVRFEEAAIVFEIEKESNETEHSDRIEEEDKEKNNKKLESKTNKKIETKSESKETEDPGMRTKYRMDPVKDSVLINNDEIRESFCNCYKLFIKGKGFIDPINNKVNK